MWTRRLCDGLEHLPGGPAPEVRELEDRLCERVDGAQGQDLGPLKGRLRQDLGKLRGSVEESTPEVRRAYEKLRNLALDDDLKRRLGGIERQHYSVSPSAADVPNFQTVNPNFLRGGQANQEGLLWLGMHGVKTEVDLRDEADQGNQWDQPTHNPLHSVNLPIPDFGSPSYATVEKFIETVDSPENQPVFVHCKAGIGRTGLMTACWRVAHGESAEEALAQESINSSYGSLKQEQFVRDFEGYWLAGHPADS